MLINFTGCVQLLLSNPEVNNDSASDETHCEKPEQKENLQIAHMCPKKRKKRGQGQCRSGLLFFIVMQFEKLYKCTVGKNRFDGADSKINCTLKCDCLS